MIIFNHPYKINYHSNHRTHHHDYQEITTSSHHDHACAAPSPSLPQNSLKTNDRWLHSPPRTNPLYYYNSHHHLNHHDHTPSLPSLRSSNHLHHPPHKHQEQRHNTLVTYNLTSHPLTYLTGDLALPLTKYCTVSSVNCIAWTPVDFAISI